MRTNAAAARPARTLAAIFEDAVTVLRQDLSEYGYIALCGGVSAAIVATVLRYIGGAVPLALIVPAVAVLALGTLATCIAALERTQDGLQPDSGQSFVEAIARAPWLLPRLLPPVLALGAAIYVSAAWGSELGTLATLALDLVLVAAAFYMALPVGMYAAALFSRDTSPRDATAHTLVIMRGSRAIVLAALLIALAPAEIAAAIALLARFGTMTTALFAFATVASMPLVAAMMSLIHAEIAPWIGPTPPAPARDSRAPAASAANVAARLDRHIR